MFAVHVLLAAVMTAGGTLQLVPQLRRRWTWLHRLNGRVFIATACVLALGGLYLVWVRGTRLGVVPAIAISLDAVLILSFSALAVSRARQGDITSHRMWALRAFMAANGVWMLRVGFMAWALTTGGAGMSKGMDGPFDTFWVFGCYLVPLGVLQAYLHVEASDSSFAKLTMAAVLGVLTIAMGAGIFGAYTLMWAPYI